MEQYLQNIDRKMKSNSQIQRRNYHQQKDQGNSNANKTIHIFSTNLQSPSITNLEKQLKNKGIQFQYHFNFQEIQEILKQNKSKAFILVCENDPDDENYDFLTKISANHQNQTAKIFSFPQKIKGTTFPTLSDEKEVIEAFDQNYKIKRNNQIRLSSIHSIKVPKDKSSSKSIKIITGSEYEKCFFFKSHYGQYGTQEESVYQQLIEALDGEARFEAFKTTKQLQKKQGPKGKKKYVVIMPTDQSAFKAILQLKKLDYFDFVLLGKLKPDEDLLNGNIVLASNSSQKLLGFLMDKGFDSANMRNIIKLFSKKQSLTIQDKNSIGRDNITNNFLSNIINPNIQDPVQLNGNFESPNGVSKLVLEDDHGDKKKIKKIKSPLKARGNQSQSLSQNNNISIVVSKHKDEPIYQNSQIFINKQGQRISKKQSQNERQNNSNRNVNNIKQEKNSGGLNKYDAAATPNPLENHFSKRSNGIQSKYRNNPSVIHEMSDEYKGSNKQSIVNLQPQRQKATVNENGISYQYYQSEPVQQNGAKRIVTKGFAYSQSPQNYYINSEKTLQVIRSSSNIPQGTYQQKGTSGTDGNIYSAANNTNNISYNRSTSPRIIAATPMTISSQPLSKQISPNKIQMQSAASYQSPSKIIKKELVSPPEIIQKQPQSVTNLQNRYTFGRNLHNNKSSSKQINSNNMQRSYSNIPPSNGSYYNVQTYNYGNTNAQQPYVSKIHTVSGQIEHISSTPTSSNSRSYRVEEHTIIGKRPEENNGKISYQSSINSANNHLMTPGVTQKQTKNAITSGGINLQEYQKFQRDGRTIYRKRVTLESNNYNPTNPVSFESKDEGSPKVIRYQASPKRVDQATANRYISPDQRVKNFINPVYSEPSKVINYSNPNKKYEVITVPYKSSDNNLGDMIESSHKKKTIEMNTLNNPNNFVGISYRNEDKGGNSYSNSYQENTGVKIYGVNHPKISVERQDRYEPKVQAHTPSPKPANLNDSNWFSRLSQLHSDGSILRRNNIRFGVKLQKKEDKIAQSHISVLENKLASGIYNVNDLNKKMALNRIIQGQEYLSAQKIKYLHINSKYNNFHFVIQEQMSYLIEILKGHITTKNDKIEKFAGVSSLYNSIKAQEDDVFDVGFIFAKPEQAACINIQLIPEHYYIVCITKDQQGFLQINQSSKKVRIDHLKYFTLAQKIILDSKLYEYVAYRNNKQQIENLADKFLNTQFILQKIQTQFSTEILDCYYYQLPRLTRVYVLCDQQELPKMMKLVKAYEDINPNFDSQTCRLLCVINNILGNGQLIMNEPNVTFISNPEKIMSHEDILGYVHHYDDQVSSFLPIDNIFYYFKHNSLDQELANVYPGRFATIPFKRLIEVYSKIEKINKLSAKCVKKPKNYLVIHEDLNSEKIKMDYFAKIFMLGKTKLLQNKVTRVINISEFIQLMK